MKDTLSKRQLEVTKLRASGLIGKEAADRMKISYRTEQKHVDQVFKKLEIHSMVELTHYALHHKLIKNIYDESPAK